MNTTAIGERTEAVCLAELVKRDFKVLTPFGNNRRYDFVIDTRHGFKSVQCKTGRLTKGRIEFNAYNAMGHYKEDVDLFLVWCPDNDKVYMVPTKDVGTSKPYLRVDPPKNGQAKGIRWAKDYELGWTIDTLIAELMREG